MSAERFRIGFLPLVDAALPILAHELGFAAREGVEIELVRDMTWATVRDRLLFGQTDAAHMIAPLAIATALGRDRPAVPMAVPFVLGCHARARMTRGMPGESGCQCRSSSLRPASPIGHSPWIHAASDDELHRP